MIMLMLVQVHLVADQPLHVSREHINFDIRLLTPTSSLLRVVAARVCGMRLISTWSPVSVLTIKLYPINGDGTLFGEIF